MADEVVKAGGRVVAALDKIGVIAATSSDPNFAAKASKISGVSYVAPDRMVQWVEPLKVSEEIAADATDVGAQAIGAGETFRLVQWAPDAVSAPAAWEAGFQGAGARVAVLDGGVNNNHIDILPNIDAGRSRSFVPGQPYNFDTGNFWHGTHVAGIVAAPANNVGVVGIAPRATLIGVKVLHNGSGQFSWVIQGIMYAATPISEGGAGADIINMSLGAMFVPVGKDGDYHLLNALSRATSYANKRGTTVIASAGNAATDLDHTANLVTVPAQSVGVIAVSALGPMGWAVPGTVFSLDRPASYTNFGQSAISLGAPGGDFALPGDAVCSKPRIVPVGAPPANVVQFCWVFDMVFSAFGRTNNGYGWAAGTSMASPAAAGVASLIVGKARADGVPLSATGVRTRLEKSADDLGKPGNDDFYGAGRVNAWRAVQ
jgi:subtilisin family serine protease